MNTLQLDINDRLAIITLNRGRANPINAEMVNELIAAVKSIDEDDSVGGLIITGKAGFFSAGIDLIEVYTYNEQESEGFWKSFLEMQHILSGFKKPLVASINGHSPAGGCIIALCCDYRVMANGPYIIGLNEIPVGIVVPEAVFHLYSFSIGKRLAYQYILEGKLLNVQEALTVGLIDAVAEPADVLVEAEKKVRVFMNMSPVTWQQSKRNLRRELKEQLEVDNTEALNKMLKQWWAPETRATLQKVINKLTNPAKS